MGEVSATVSGRVGNGGLPTSYYFEYGPSASYGAHTAVSQLAASSADSTVSATLRGLRPGTTYHYRVVATNSDGTSSGGDQTFRTARRISTVFTGLSKSYSLAKIAHRGVAMTLGCSQPCKISASILIPKQTVKRLHLGKGQITLGAGSLLLTRGGRRSVHLHLTNKSQKLITRLGRVLVTVRVASTPTHGGPTIVVTRSATFTG